MVTARKFISIASILCIFLLAACAHNIEKTKNSAATESAVPDTIHSTQTEINTPLANQPTNIPESKPVQQKTTPVHQQATIPETKLNQSKALPNQPGQVSSPNPVPAPTNMPGPLPKQQGTLPGNQQANMPESMPKQQNVPFGERGKSATSSPMDMPSFNATTGSRTIIGRGMVSLNFDDADIYSVILTVFSEVLKVNYIIDPRVKGRVTFRSIAPVPYDNVLPLMEVILRLNGVAVVEENNLYRIIPITELAREPSAINFGQNAEKVIIKGKALLQVVPIEHLPSSDIVKLVTPFVSTSAVIVDVPKTNHIIIVDTDANVKRLLQLINIFDTEQQKRKGPQVFVYHVQNSKAKDIGTLLQQIFLSAKQTADKGSPQVYQADKGTSQTSPSTQPFQDKGASQVPSSTQTLQSQGKSGVAEGVVSDLVKIFADEILNAIIILGTPEDYQIIKETIIKLDIIPRQVLIEGAIAQIQLTDKMKLGLAWSIKNSILDGQYSVSLNPSSLDPTTLPTSGLSVIGIDSAGSVRAVINALASQSKAKLLASPHIMVSDNREARIQVGQQVPIITSETIATVGVAPQRTIQYKDIGIILKVKPQINDSGLVAMQISQEVSTYVKDVLYANETQIILNKTEVSTNLVVQNGQTIVIGGLIREDDSKAKSGIPFLSKIPILGYLFGTTDNDVERTELVILLTPQVVKTQQEAAAITNKYLDKMTDEQMNKEVKKGMQMKALEDKEDQ
jgi:general secretion pathway protein D